MEEEMHQIHEHGQPRKCELEDETNEYNSMSQVWVKEEVLVKQEVMNDLEPEFKGKLTSYMEKDHTSTNQFKEDEITEKHEPIPQVWVKEEIKLEPLDPSQSTDELKLHSEDIPNSSDECKRENEDESQSVSPDFDFEDFSVVEECLVPEDANEHLQPVSITSILPSITLSSTSSTSGATAKTRKRDRDMTIQETELLNKAHNILENVRKTKEVKNDLDILGELVSATLKSIKNKKLVLKAKRQISDVLLSVQEEDLRERENHNVENGDEGINEETEIQDVKSVCETVHEPELSASISKYPICRKTTIIQKKLYKCQICNKEFTKKSEIHSHLSIHADNYKCDICLKVFVHQRTLRKHKLILHGDEGKHLCPSCIKQFKTNSELQAHLISHHDKRMYPCSLCKKLFMRQQSLTMHLRTHSADNRFKCEVCLRRFSRYLRFEEHERLHTGEKPFKCSVCEKEFVRRSSMICHQRLHTREKFHACNMCEKKFSRRYRLVRHLRGHPQSDLNKSTESN